MITIKKYPNRRLYNTTSKSFISQAQLFAIIHNHSNQPIRIIDQHTHDDISQRILHQLVDNISQQYGTPLLSASLLIYILRHIPIRNNASEPTILSVINKALTTFLRINHPPDQSPCTLHSLDVQAKKELHQWLCLSEQADL